MKYPYKYAVGDRFHHQLPVSGTPIVEVTIVKCLRGYYYFRPVVNGMVLPPEQELVTDSKWSLYQTWWWSFEKDVTDRVYAQIESPFL